MAIGDKKKKLFRDEPAMPEQPKRATIREAEGGFIVECGEYYGEKQKVAKTLAAAMKLVKEHFGSDKADDESEDD